MSISIGLARVSGYCRCHGWYWSGKKEEISYLPPPRDSWAELLDETRNHLNNYSTAKKNKIKTKTVENKF